LLKSKKLGEIRRINDLMNTERQRNKEFEVYTEKEQAISREQFDLKVKQEEEELKIRQLKEAEFMKRKKMVEL
jgi:hypothetical protein